MAIRVVDFSEGGKEIDEWSEEHIKFDDSGDYLHVNGEVIEIYSAEHDCTTALVRREHINNLIQALNYLKEKHA